MKLVDSYHDAGNDPMVPEKSDQVESPESIADSLFLKSGRAIIFRGGKCDVPSRLIWIDTDGTWAGYMDSLIVDMKQGIANLIRRIRSERK